MLALVIETHTQHPLLPMRMLREGNRGGSYWCS